MKTWNAPEMEELDVRMTLSGTNTYYSEDYAGFLQYCNDEGISPDEWSIKEFYPKACTVSHS